MKLMIASDLHGSDYWCARMLEAFETEQPERLMFLGDILYHRCCSGVSEVDL